MAYEPGTVVSLVGNLPVKLRYALAVKTGLLAPRDTGITQAQKVGELEGLEGREWTEKVLRRDFRPVLMRGELLLWMSLVSSSRQNCETSCTARLSRNR